MTDDGSNQPASLAGQPCQRNRQARSPQSRAISSPAPASSQMEAMAFSETPALQQPIALQQTSCLGWPLRSPPILRHLGECATVRFEGGQLAGKVLPPLNRDIDISRVKLNGMARAPGHLRCYDGRS